MTVQVTKEDIARGGRSGGDNPISHGLMRATGQAWVVFGGSIAYSRSAPHRALALPFEVLQSWRAWMWQPFEFQVEWAHSSSSKSEERRERRQIQRRAAPRFGFDRRARDRRNTDRRRQNRREHDDQKTEARKSPYSMRGSFSPYDRRTAPRRDADAVAREITAETPGEF